MRTPRDAFIYPILLFLLGCSYLGSRYPLQVEKIAVAEISTRAVLQPAIAMHHGVIRKISVDNDQKYLVTASLDKTIRIWRYKKGRYECNLEKILRLPFSSGSEGKVYALAISPNGRTLAAAGWTGIRWERTSSIYLFDIQSGQLIHRITGLPNVVHHLAFSPLGTFLVATFGGKSGISVYDTVFYNLVARDRYYQGATYYADFNALERLVTASQDGYLRLYDKNFQLLAQVRPKNGKTPYCVSFSPDDLQIAVSFSDSRDIEIVADKTLEHIESITGKGLQGETRCVCWGKDGSLYTSGEIDGQQIIRRYSPRQRNRYEDIEVKAHYQIQHLSAMTDGDVAFCTADPSFGIIGGDKLYLYKKSPILDYRDNNGKFAISPDASVVQFNYDREGKVPAYFAISPGKAQLLQSHPRDASGRYIPLFPAFEESEEIEIGNWRNASAPTVNGRRIPLGAYDISRSVAVAPQKKVFALATDHAIHLFDSQAQRLWKAPISASAWRLNISRNERYLVAILANGTLRWYDLQDGREILAFFTTNDSGTSKKRWIAWTPQNYYSASTRGESLVAEVRNKSEETLASEQPILAVNRTNQIFAEVFGATAEPSSIPQQEEQDSDNSPSLTRKTDEGNSLAPKNPTKKPTLYLLSVGISKYSEPSLTLHFAAQDAIAFAAAFQRQRQTYQKVVEHILTDEKANQMGILRGLDFIQENCTEQDIAIVFLSGHGEKDAYGDYYFLPADFYPKRGFKRTAIEFNEIQRVITSIPGKVVLFLDTCRSGAVDINDVIDDFAKSNTQLVVLSSATGNQVALESATWQHGAFTKAAIEGIGGKAGYKGEISVHQLYVYISQRVKELTEGRQTPTIMVPNSSHDFVIAKVE